MTRIILILTLAVTLAACSSKSYTGRHYDTPEEKAEIARIAAKRAEDLARVKADRAEAAALHKAAQAKREADKKARAAEQAKRQAKLEAEAKAYNEAQAKRRAKILAEIKAEGSGPRIKANKALVTCVADTLGGLKTSGTRDLETWRALPIQVCSTEISSLAAALFRAEQPHYVATKINGVEALYLEKYTADVVRDTQKAISEQFSSWLKMGAPS
jgi:Skp family chaperone for outer membrane proteins